MLLNVGVIQKQKFLNSTKSLPCLIKGSRDSVTFLFKHTSEQFYYVHSPDKLTVYLGYLVQ